MSAINLSGNASGSGTFTIASPNSNTSYTLALPEEAGTITTSNSPYSTFRNRIINGDMRIDQRYAGTATANTISGYTVDRWHVSQSVTGKIIAQQNAGSVTPPAGFNNYLGITSQSAYSVLSSDYYMVYQMIEGYNVADLALGTANAKTFTVSFWVRSSLTGTFGGSIQNNAANRSYPFTYTISAADTWEYKTVTIAGDTSGTWEKTTSTGLRVQFGLGVGASYTGTAGSWQGANDLSADSSVSVVGTNGATFYITGVQLEVGSVATPFERRPYGTELMLCQRYYYLLVSGTSKSFMNGSALSASQVRGHVQLPVTMRTAPSINQTSGSNYYQFDASTAVFVNDFQTAYSTDTGILLYQSGISATAGQGGTWLTNNSSAYIAFSAEL